MEKKPQNKQKSTSEIITFDAYKFSNLKYIKMIFIDKNKELQEIQAEAHSLNNDIIQLLINDKTNINITCPTGVVLKLVTTDSIHFAKVILKELKSNNDKYILVLDTPQKTIRQQNREFYRINIDCPCVLLIDNDKNNNKAYIAQSVNISKGGALISNLESISIMEHEHFSLQINNGDSCYITMFLEQNLKVKSYSKFVRTETVDNTYRYALQFLNIPNKYSIPFDKYLANEEYKLLKTIKNK